MARIHNKEYHANYYLANRDRIVEMQKEWRESIAGKRHKFNRLLSRVGIAAIDWAFAWVSQDAKCAGCLQPLDGGQNTHIDHCHETGRFRGLLCSSCNLALGKIGDCSETLRRLADYLEDSRG